MWPNDSDMQFRVSLLPKGMCVIGIFQVFECLGSWLQLGGFPPEAVATSPLIRAPFKSLVSYYLCIYVQIL